MKAHDKFGIELEFKSLLEDGVLLYSQQRKDPALDFLSLAIVAGYVDSFWGRDPSPPLRLPTSLSETLLAKESRKNDSCFR